MSVFEEALALTPVTGDADHPRFSGAVHPGFQNMIGPYGGWSAAILAKALIGSVSKAHELVSLTVDFLSAVPDGPVTLETRCDRAGKGTSYWSADLVTEGRGEVATRATGILAKRRETLEWTQPEFGTYAPPEQIDRVELGLAWADALDMRVAENPPFTGTGDTRSWGWARIDDDRPLDPVRLVALADTPVPRVFFHVTQPEIISTVSMTVYLHASPEDYAAVGADYLLIEADGARGGRGFFDQHARMWSRDGRLLATTQQVVWYRAKPQGET